jgi:hypothetical protein
MICSATIYISLFIGDFYLKIETHIEKLNFLLVASVFMFVTAC